MIARTRKGFEHRNGKCKCFKEIFITPKPQIRDVDAVTFTVTCHRRHVHDKAIPVSLVSCRTKVPSRRCAGTYLSYLDSLQVPATSGTAVGTNGVLSHGANLRDSDSNGGEERGERS